MGSRQWPLSMFHLPTTVINITFPNFRVNLREGLRVLVGCRLGTPVVATAGYVM